MIEIFTILQIVVPLIVSTLLFLGPNKNISYFTTTFVSLLLTIASCVILYYTLSGNYHYYFGGWLPPLGIELIINTTNAVMLCLISFSSLLALLLGYQPFMTQLNNQSAFCSLLLISLTGMYGIVLTNDFFNLYVFIEISSLALYALTSVGSRESAKAAFNYLIVGTVGAVLMLLGIGFLYSATGTLNISHFTKMLGNIESFTLIYVGSYLIIAGLILKSAIFPVHSWLVDLYNKTNQVILPFISAVSTKIYIFILIKMATSILPLTTPIITKISLLAILGTIVMSVAATRQSTIRGVLAYSTLANICYIALVLNSKHAVIIALILIVSHSLVKFTLFVLTNYIINYKKTDDLSGIGSLLTDMPMVTIMFIINGASLVGMPLTVGFLSKAYLLSSLIHAESWTATLSVLVTSCLSLIYMWKIIEVTLNSNSIDKRHYINTKVKVQENYLLKYGVLLLTLLNLIIGTYFISIPFNWQLN